MKILITSTSFQDTEGDHKKFLENKKFKFDFKRGPLTQKQLIPIIHNYDYIICGDDDYNRKVLEKGKKGKLKAISKYGVGLDKIDLDYAKKFDIKIFNTPNINCESVAEHVFALILSYEKNIIKENEIVRKGSWVRLIGHEIFNKNILIIGLGGVGKQVSLRAKAFGMNVFVFDIKPDIDFINKHALKLAKDIREVLDDIDYISLNLPLNEKTKHIIDFNILECCKDGVIIVNTARAELIDLKAIINFLNNGKVRAYLTDVLEQEPIKPNHPFIKMDNVIITPHIGSRNFETVERQGLKAVENLLKYINLKK